MHLCKTDHGALKSWTHTQMCWSVCCYFHLCSVFVNVVIHSLYKPCGNYRWRSKMEVQN